jgi:hypothetical protein
MSPECLPAQMPSMTNLIGICHRGSPPANTAPRPHIPFLQIGWHTQRSTTDPPGASRPYRGSRHAFSRSHVGEVRSGVIKMLVGLRAYFFPRELQLTPLSVADASPRLGALMQPERGCPLQEGAGAPIYSVLSTLSRSYWWSVGRRHFRAMRWAVRSMLRNSSRLLA